MHVIWFDRLAGEPATVMRELFSFLGVDPEVPCNVDRVFNRGGLPRSSRVAAMLARPGRLKGLFKAIVPERVRVRLRERISSWNTGTRPEPDAASVEYLRGYFRDDLDRLHELLGRPVPFAARDGRRRNGS